MKCEAFDQDIENTFSQYGKLGVKVDLLMARDRPSVTPPYDWIDVMVETAPVIAQPSPQADTWHYGGLISKTTSPVPLGIRVINKDKLIGSENAAKKLPPGFDLQTANCELSWHVNNTDKEPTYSFYHDKAHHSIGAYTGTIIKE